MMIFYLLSGTFLLFLGAEWIIRGGAALALRLRLPLLVIGLIIIGFGTSTPELVVSVEASLAGKGDIAIGNVIGSNIANTGLILGFSAIVHPLPIQKRLLRTDIPVMVATAFFIFIIFLVFSSYSRLVGGMLLCGLISYTVWSINHGRNTYVSIQENSRYALGHWILEVVLVLAGLAALLFGGTLFLNGAVSFARFYGISDRVIGLTIVALGTSLPEMATSAVAAFRRHGELAIGNIIGSNIFNMLGIAGAAALVEPINLSYALWIDLSFMLVLFVGLWVICRQGRFMKKWHGAAFFFSYLAYMSYLFYSG